MMLISVTKTVYMLKCHTAILNSEPTPLPDFLFAIIHFPNIKRTACFGSQCINIDELLSFENHASAIAKTSVHVIVNHMVMKQKVFRSSQFYVSFQIQDSNLSNSSMKLSS